VLVFLPGVEEIRCTQRRTQVVADAHNALLLPLHGTLPLEEQMRALAPAPAPYRRKIILATNIAETSLTIDGVTSVIDSGLARVAGYDARRGLDRLELKRISLASATQRAGRAGRTRPGRCLRLWTRSQEHHLAAQELPEIQRVDLASTVLMLHAWGKPDPAAFDWLDAPAPAALAAAENLLILLGALAGPLPGKITPLGRRLLSVPAHPRLARLLLAAADAGCAQEGATLAAILSEKDFVLRGAPAGPLSGPPTIRPTNLTDGPSDLLWRAELLRQAEASKFAPHTHDLGIDPHAARHVARTRDDLLRSVRSSGPRPSGPSAHGPASADDTLLLKLPLLAYPDRVVRRRASNPDSGIMVGMGPTGGSGVRLGFESIVRQGEFFLALDAWQDPRQPGQEATVRLASRIEPEWLAELFPDQVTQTHDVLYDAQADRIVPCVQVRYRDLVLSEDRHGRLDPQRAAAALLEAARPRIAEIFAAHKSAANLIARITLLRSALPEQPWPALDDAQLCQALADSGQLSGRRALADLAAAPLADVLRALLVYPLDRQLDELAPETITVPTGNRIRIDYTANPPVLAVRLQEMFGQTDTPRIAGGRIPLLLHLLAPNYRPVQITTDLRSFWANAYFQTRKDLRIRYPKHAWPEDPLTAPPVAKGRPQR
jgi:ATP-dependent helicase HrpB